MKCSCLRSYSLQSVGDCGETLKLNPPCCTQRSEVPGLPDQWEGLGLEVLIFFGGCYNQVGLQI